ncbi:VWA domain-containing protein [uncultured Cocleimonas sp.]|uniref:vWA domain-containing protein n=1 Tax=uncultured Cocleimonas sp. TaxID=1051587 RepID=UPI002631605C|nr:VWA domain-containing protein [uncultured Cocleimonas sp.]
MKLLVTTSLLAFCVCMFQVQADEVCDSQALYEKLDAENPGDTSRCDIQIKDPKIEDCPLPKTFSGGERPASHVVLLIDASGSMAGKLGGKSKMSIAKRESLRFLGALQKDVPVGMIVYGHKGNNTKSGKAESCSSVEWVHKLGAGMHTLKKSIKSLKPVGYTPMGDALDYTLDELKKVRKSKKNKESVPIVYLLSDGKETCGGDPVASAKALHESGVRAVVNVIGFDVGKETRQQLEAISEAGGGKYFPAKDAKALRKQLNAAHDTEMSLLHYERCLFSNLSHTVGVHNNALLDAIKCQTREITKPFSALQKTLKAMVADGTISKECASKTKSLAYQQQVKDGRWLLEKNKEIRAHQEKALENMKKGSIWKGL